MPTHLPDRRAFLDQFSRWGLACWPPTMAGCSLTPITPQPSPPPGPPGLTTAIDTAVDTAFDYAFPLYEMARTRYGALESPLNPARGAANVLGHRRTLSDHRARNVTTPNNDTLYSSGWLDLSAGPVQVTVATLPDGRYWSVALMDMFTNHIAMLGSRLDGRGPVRATLVGPGWAGPRPAGRVIRCPGNDVWLLGRWLVDGPADLGAARAMQDSLKVQGPPGLPASPRVLPRGSADPENFLAVVNQALAHNPPPAADAGLLAGLAAVGLRAGAVDAWARLPEPVRAAWRQRIGPAHERLKAGLGHSHRQVQGWRLPPPEIGNFGHHHALRAAVALGGLAALEPAEAVYYARTEDDAGLPLDGQQRYRIRAPAGGLPVAGFWSLSVYERLPDGRLFFTDNPAQRYAIGDRSPGLQRQPDGSLDLWLQRDPPTDAALQAHWLPAPPGPTQLSLRAYLPLPALRDGLAPLPTVLRVG